MTRGSPVTTASTDWGHQILLQCTPLDSPSRMRTHIKWKHTVEISHNSIHWLRSPALLRCLDADHSPSHPVTRISRLKPMHSMWLRILSSKSVEETFEKTQIQVTTRSPPMLSTRLTHFPAPALLNAQWMSKDTHIWKHTVEKSHLTASLFGWCFFAVVKKSRRADSI